MMFKFLDRFFKKRRTQMQRWEILMLTNLFSDMPRPYSEFKEQIDEKYIRGVVIGLSDIPNYIGLSYTELAYKYFYDEMGQNYVIHGAKFLDNTTKSMVELSVYVSHGMINGYRVSPYAEFDSTTLSIDKLQIVPINSNADIELRSMLTASEYLKISHTDVDKFIIHGIELFKFKDLNDGDFLAVDKKKNVFLISHESSVPEPIYMNIIDSIEKYSY